MDPASSELARLKTTEAMARLRTWNIYVMAQDAAHCDRHLYTSQLEGAIEALEQASVAVMRAELARGTAMRKGRIRGQS